jgi:SAM-dependent methyltransferase
MNFSGAQLSAAAAEFGYPMRPAGPAALSSKPSAAAKQCVSDVWAFTALGFDTVSVLDANDYENPTFLHDLNSPRFPKALANAFDLVLDAGTLEHVFDVPTALRTLCQMTRPGGRIVHISPVSNCVDHGFYSFSPTLFADFYAANAFEILRLVIARFDKDPAGEEWQVEDYDPSVWGTIGAVESGSCFLVACVKRYLDSTWDKVPQQSYYQNRAWRQGARGKAL